MALPYDTGLGFYHVSARAAAVRLRVERYTADFEQSSEFLIKVSSSKRPFELGRYIASCKTLTRTPRTPGISAERDIYLAKLKYYSRIPAHQLTPDGQKETLAKRIKQLGAMENWIGDQLGRDPDLHWQTKEGRLFVTIDGYAPAYGLKIVGDFPERFKQLGVQSADFPDLKIP